MFSCRWNIRMQIAVYNARQLDSVAQLVRALHQNRRFDSFQIQTSVAFFETAPGYSIPV